MIDPEQPLERLKDILTVLETDFGDYRQYIQTSA